MSGNEHARWSEDLSAYMLGALEPAEAAALERHLEGCESCRKEMRWLAPAVRALPEAVERQEPPRQLREGLMAAVRADARREEAATRGRRSSLPDWMRGRGMRLATGFAVVALLVAVAVGYEIGKGGSGEGGSSTVVSRQADGIDVKMVREGKKGTLELENVRQLPPGRVLEAWVRREGTIEPVAALFVPDREGKASTTIADMSGVDTVMVTREPQGGSKQPSSEPIVTMAVPQ
jgi:anti-sigma-K factor RskA